MIVDHFVVMMIVMVMTIVMIMTIDKVGNCALNNFALKGFSLQNESMAHQRHFLHHAAYFSSKDTLLIIDY